MIGPYRLNQTVCLIRPWLRVRTVTVWLVMATAWPLYTYSVGWPGTRVSWYGVSVQEREVVSLHAIEPVNPMTITGTPTIVAPSTFIVPGIVNCTWYRWSAPSQGRCGLPSNRPLR